MAKIKHCDRSKTQHYVDGGQIGPYIDAHRQTTGAIKAIQERDAENAKHLNKEQIMGNPAPSGSYDQNPQYRSEKSRPFDSKSLDEGMKMEPKRPWKLYKG